MACRLAMTSLPPRQVLFPIVVENRFVLLVLVMNTRILLRLTMTVVIGMRLKIGMLSFREHVWNEYFQSSTLT